MICRWLIVLYIVILVLIGGILVAESLLPVRAEPDLPPRETPVPTLPPGGDDDGKDDKPLGAHIVLQVESAPVGVWTMVQRQDSAGGWHDIDGWQGTLDEGNQKMWWLAADLFGKGPFRWLVYQSPRGDKLLATSDSFYPPDAAGEKLWVEVSLSE